MTNISRREVITGLFSLAVGGVSLLLYKTNLKKDPNDISTEAAPDPLRTSTSNTTNKNLSPASTMPTPETKQTTTTVQTTANEPSVETNPERKEYPVPLICRDTWGATPIRTGMTTHTLERLTIHHTETRIQNPAEIQTHIRAVQRIHQDEKGWADIAYHFLIGPEGSIYEGRSSTYAGDTGSMYDPAGHFLVCIVGDFNHAEPNRKQIQAAAEIFAWGSDHFNIPVATLAAHRDYADTDCPGENLYPLVSNGELTKQVESILAKGKPKLIAVCL